MHYMGYLLNRTCRRRGALRRCTRARAGKYFLGFANVTLRIRDGSYDPYTRRSMHVVCCRIGGASRDRRADRGRVAGYFCPMAANSGQTAGPTGYIGEQSFERRRKRRGTNVPVEKITIPKDVCSREMDIEISRDARTVEISIDSQLGRIPSVVPAPIPQPRPPPLPMRELPSPPPQPLLPPPVILTPPASPPNLRGSYSRSLLLFADISAERVSRITTPLSSASSLHAPLALPRHRVLFPLSPRRPRSLSVSQVVRVGGAGPKTPLRDSRQ